MPVGRGSGPAAGPGRPGVGSASGERPAIGSTSQAVPARGSRTRRGDHDRVPRRSPPARRRTPRRARSRSARRSRGVGVVRRRRGRGRARRARRRPRRRASASRSGSCQKCGSVWPGSSATGSRSDDVGGVEHVALGVLRRRRRRRPAGSRARRRPGRPRAIVGGLRDRQLEVVRLAPGWVRLVTRRGRRPTRSATYCSG